MSQVLALDVTILGKSYRVGCPAGQEAALTEAAAYLDSKMNEIAQSGKINGADRIAIMAALNIAHELIEAKRSIENKSDMGEIESVLERMSDKINQVTTSSATTESV